MIEQLKSAIEQLHTAWDNYSNVHSTLQKYTTEKTGSHIYSFPPEIIPLLDAELGFLSSLPSKIKQTETAIGRARNYSSGVAPINALPPEILTRIFYFVLDHPCKFCRTGWIKYPRYPDYLTQVCSLWRQTAIFCPFLWHHMDLTLDEQLYHDLVDRAEYHWNRTGGIPLELHFAEDGQGDYDESSREPEYLFDFLQRKSPYIGTLELAVTGTFGPYHRTVFDGLFHDGDSNLTKLVLHSRSEHRDTFVYPNSIDRHERDDALDQFRLDMSESMFARGFSTISVLHVHGIFPCWSTTAYHGLVDLRLLSTSKPSHIDEAQIRKILSSSPALRILHFGLEINNPQTDHVAPVVLHDLEVLKVFSAGEVAEPLRPSDIIRILAPGQNPLRLSLEDHYHYSLLDTLPADLDRFLSRVNVVQIHINSVIIPFNILFRHSAHLQRVILTEFNAQSQHRIRASLAHVDASDSSGCLSSLRIQSSDLSQGDLRTLLSCCPAGTVLDRCNIYHDENKGTTLMSKEELSTAFPEVKIGSAEDPAADWDILD